VQFLRSVGSKNKPSETPSLDIKPPISQIAPSETESPI